MVSDKLGVPVYEGDFVVCSPYDTIAKIHIGLVTKILEDRIRVSVYYDDWDIPSFLYRSERTVKIPYFNVPDDIRRTLHASASVVE